MLSTLGWSGASASALANCVCASCCLPRLASAAPSAECRRQSGALGSWAWRSSFSALAVSPSSSASNPRSSCSRRSAGLGGRRRVEHGQRLWLGAARPQRPRIGEGRGRIGRIGLVRGSERAASAGWPAFFWASRRPAPAASGPVKGAPADRRKRSGAWPNELRHAANRRDEVCALCSLSDIRNPLYERAQTHEPPDAPR